MTKTGQFPSSKRVPEFITARPIDAGLVLCITIILFYFYLIFDPFRGGIRSALGYLWWSWSSPEMDYTHGKLAPLIIAFLIWNVRDKIRAARKSTYPLGWLVLSVGLGLYILSVRVLHPRIAVGALPIILLGIILIFWGKETARHLLFPLFFIWLVIPIPGFQQATAWLQGYIANSVELIVGIFGVQVQAIGADLLSKGPDEFRFTVAGGCSGVRSLMAMSMLAALYVYFTQDKLWKQILIFAFTLLFTVIGNVARVSSIVLIAKMGFRDFAAGAYHDYSVFLIFFPVALATMVGFAKVVNLDYPKLVRACGQSSCEPR